MRPDRAPPHPARMAAWPDVERDSLQASRACSPITATAIVGERAAVDGKAESVEAAVLAASLSLADALVQNDPEAIGALLADQWLLVDPDGPTTRNRFLELVRSGALTRSMMQPAGDLEVAVYGGTAIVFGRIVNTAHLAGQTVHADEWTTDIFVCQEARWRCVHSHVTEAGTHP